MLSQQGDNDKVNAFPSMNPETDDATNRIQVAYPHPIILNIKQFQHFAIDLFY